MWFYDCPISEETNKCKAAFQQTRTVQFIRNFFQSWNTSRWKKGVKNTYSIQNKIIIFFSTFMHHKWRRDRQDKFNFYRFKFA